MKHTENVIYSKNILNSILKSSYVKPQSNHKIEFYYLNMDTKWIS